MLQRLIFAVLLCATAVASGCNKFYRKDYTYIESFDAFYKLHWDLAGLTWRTAFLACDDEGSTLFYPKIKDEWAVVSVLVGAMKHKPNVTDIFVGIHNEFGLGEFMTVDGLSTPSPLPDKDLDSVGQSACVTMEISTGVHKLASCETDTVKPFVCKKVKEIVPSCPTIDSDYTYDSEIKKCYKFSQRKKTWSDALQTCFMEGGNLAVINNKNDASAIDILLQVKGLYNVDHFVGFRRLFPHGDFYTVKGQKFDNGFYHHWRDTTGDYINDCGILRCGHPGPDGLEFSTIPCLETASFICEMVPKG